VQRITISWLIKVNLYGIVVIDETLVSSDSVFGADYGLFFRLLLRVLRIIIGNMTTRV